MQAHCDNRWLARLQLRDEMMDAYRDFKMLDWVLKQVVNVRIGGYAIYRSRYNVTRSFYYRWVRAAPASCIAHSYDLIYAVIVLC